MVELRSASIDSMSLRGQETGSGRKRAEVSSVFEMVNSLDADSIVKAGGRCCHAWGSVDTE